MITGSRHKYRLHSSGDTSMASPVARPTRKLSVAEMMATNAKGGPDMSSITDPVTGMRLSNAEAGERMPAGGYQVGGYGGGRGRGGHGGGYVGGGPRSRISSAGVAGGVSTSVRGRMEAELMANPEMDPAAALEAAQMPAWQKTSEDWAENALKPNPRYGNMGRPPVRAYARGTDDSGSKPRVAIVGEEGPEAVVLPARSKVIPTSITESAFGPTALDELTGVSPPAPLTNPYLGGRSNAPMPRDAFRTSAASRYDDLAHRLAALRDEGFASGRARVLENTQRQQAEMADREKFLASGEQVSEAEGGGTLYRTKYGTAVVGSNRPKSFTVENFEGGQTTSSNLAEVDRESRTDAAERTVRGLGLRNYVGYGAPRQVAPPATEPSAIDEVAPPAPSVPAVEAPVLAARGAASVVSGARDIAPPPKEKQIVDAPTAIDEVEEVEVQDMGSAATKKGEDEIHLLAGKWSMKESERLKSQGYKIRILKDGSLKATKEKAAA